MNQEERYRHELKYNINFADYISLQKKLKLIMKQDNHINAEGNYLIRSIYFDNYKDKALKEKLNGISRREKFRIRYYNDDFSFITLEKKMKHNELCKKLKTVLTIEECINLCSGKIDWMCFHSEALIRELYYKMKNELLRPRVIVSYIREPYIFSAGNVRVTFDFDIRSSLYQQPLLTTEVMDINTMDTYNSIVLEIKYDDFFPEVIKHLIQTANIRQQAFSKYSVCRKFG